ncbi:MAG TPA: beta-galactosidase [Dictyoglomaceae bacterium]|nr:beta-galactosidase [Dictyoglomaceae bacterium]
MKKLLFGVAYYDEYMPYDRLNEDIKMMLDAKINTVRIAESTWSTMEPQDGIFDFSHIDRVLDAMEKNGINVIIGTPTYAIPAWMAKSYPEIIAETKNGRRLYGARQIMDITHPAYLFYAERVIRKLMERVAKRKCVIGYQIDNETKYYDTSSQNVQQKFIKYLRKKFNDDLKALNLEFGLDYWSNRINSWEEFPDVRGTINGSLGAEFDKFRRMLVDEFLSWQAGIVNEYKTESQFITHNFDFDWRGYSYGLQPMVNHFNASKPLTIAGCDIYHPSQDKLTGEEIAFGGDITRSLKQDNYLVIETQAQGHLSWLPYKGQLRLQAYSHLASGANSVMYWHWHSIHNSAETYWKGLLSHDFAENDTYLEAKEIGKEFEILGEKLINLKKSNKIAIMVSNESLTALNWFKIETGMMFGESIEYNDVLRWIYNGFYKMNAECDFITVENENLSKYTLLILPALYAVPESTLKRINDFVKNGGHLISTFKTAVANENVKVYSQTMPHIINECLGVSYNQFTKPEGVLLSQEKFSLPEEDRKVLAFMELLKPSTAEVMASYEHYAWNSYAAITQNKFGSGLATYIGCFTSESYLMAILEDCLKKAGLWGDEQKYSFPVIIRKGTNDFGKEIIYFFNYSKEEQKITYKGSEGINLFEDKKIKDGDTITIKPWNLVIIEN